MLMKYCTRPGMVRVPSLRRLDLDGGKILKLEADQNAFPATSSESKGRLPDPGLSHFSS